MDKTEPDKTGPGPGAGPEDGGQLNRNRSFKSKQLVRSQAIRESHSPPRAASPHRAPPGADAAPPADGEDGGADPPPGAADGDGRKDEKKLPIEIQVSGGSWDAESASEQRQRARRWLVGRPHADGARAPPPGARMACVCGACDCYKCRQRRRQCPLRQDSGIVCSADCADCDYDLLSEEVGVRKAESFEDQSLYCRCSDRQERPFRQKNISFSRSDSDIAEPTWPELVHFIKATLNKNARDRETLLKVEKELYALVNDPGRCVVRFPVMTSYGRMLVHRCAALFRLAHRLDAAHRSTVLVSKSGSNGGCIPCTRFKQWCVATFPKSPPCKADDTAAKSILRRAAGGEDAGAGAAAAAARSLEQRERDYERDTEWPWLTSGPIKLLTPEPGRNKLIKVQSLEARGAGDGAGARGAVSKSHSLDECGAEPPHARLLSRQGDLASSSWRLSPSSSGYKTLSLRSTDSVTPSPTGCPSPETPAASAAPAGGAGGGEAPPPGAEAGGAPVVWAVTDITAVPPGALVIHPQTGRPLVNADGSLYQFDPANPPVLQDDTLYLHNGHQDAEKRRRRLEKQQSFIDTECGCPSERCGEKCCCDCPDRETCTQCPVEQTTASPRNSKPNSIHNSPSKRAGLINTLNKNPSSESTKQRPTYDNSTNQRPGYDNSSNQRTNYNNATNQRPAYDNSNSQRSTYDNTNNQRTAYDNSTYQRTAMESANQYLTYTRQNANSRYDNNQRYGNPRYEATNHSQAIEAAANQRQVLDASNNQRQAIERTNQRQALEAANQRQGIETANRQAVETANQRQAIETANQRQANEPVNQRQATETANQRQAVQTANQRQTNETANQRQTSDTATQHQTSETVKQGQNIERANQRQTVDASANQRQSVDGAVNQRQQSEQPVNQRQAVEVSANQRQTIDVSATQRQIIDVSATQRQTVEVSANQRQIIEVSANQRHLVDVGANQRTYEAQRYELQRPASYEQGMQRIEIQKGLETVSYAQNYIQYQNEEITSPSQGSHYTTPDVADMHAAMGQKLTPVPLVDANMRPLSLASNVACPAAAHQAYPYVNHCRLDQPVYQQLVPLPQVVPHMLPAEDQKHLTPSPHPETTFRIDPSYPYATDFGATCGACSEPAAPHAPPAPHAPHRSVSVGYGPLELQQQVVPQAYPLHNIMPQIPPYPYQEAAAWAGGAHKLLLPDVYPLLCPALYPAYNVLYPQVIPQGYPLCQPAYPLADKPAEAPRRAHSPRAPRRAPPAARAARSPPADVALTIAHIQQQLAHGERDKDERARGDWRRRGGGLLGSHPADLGAGAAARSTNDDSHINSALYNCMRNMQVNQYYAAPRAADAARGARDARRREPHEPRLSRDRGGFRPDFRQRGLNAPLPLRPPYMFRQMNPNTWTRRSPGVIPPVMSHPRRPQPDRGARR